MVETTEHAPQAESARRKALITEAAVTRAWKPETLAPELAPLMVDADREALG